MAFVLSKNSKAKLEGVHPDLVRVVERAIQITTQDFAVVQGARTIKQQQELYAQGRTKPGPKVTWTMRSRHIGGKAVDLAAWVDGGIDWDDLRRYDRIAEAMLSASKELGIPVIWGGSWQTTKDRPHFELDAAKYP